MREPESGMQRASTGRALQRCPRLVHAASEEGRALLRRQKHEASTTYGPDASYGMVAPLPEPEGSDARWGGGAGGMSAAEPTSEPTATPEPNVCRPES